MDIEKVLDEVWVYLDCGREKPRIRFRRQHPTARYESGTNTISIREDSFRKMPDAEKKLVILHEALHACGVGHKPGFRTSMDSLSNFLYPRIWGVDDDWVEFERMLLSEVERIRRR